MSDQNRIFLQRAICVAGLLLLAAGGTWFFSRARASSTADTAPTPAAQPPVEKMNPLATLVDRVVPTSPELADVLPTPPRATPATTSRIAPAAATPAPVVGAPSPTPAATPSGLRKLEELSTGEKPDLLLVKRTERRFARLQEWAARLNAKRATLKTPLQIEAFNEEAAKYHAELQSARQEAAQRQP